MINITINQVLDDEEFSGCKEKNIVLSYTDEVTWDEIIRNFEGVIKTLGYEFDGHLEMVDDKGEDKLPIKQKLIRESFGLNSLNYLPD